MFLEIHFCIHLCLNTEVKKKCTRRINKTITNPMMVTWHYSRIWKVTVSSIPRWPNYNDCDYWRAKTQIRKTWFWFRTILDRPHLTNKTTLCLQGFGCGELLDHFNHTVAWLQAIFKSSWSIERRRGRKQFLFIWRGHWNCKTDLTWNWNLQQGIWNLSTEN